jgi:hypothetical protein
MPTPTIRLSAIVAMLACAPLVLAQTLRVTEYRTRYTNVDYGFSVAIPEGWIGDGSVPPNPNHGFVIRLSSKTTVWVDATYEMPVHLINSVR